MVGMWTMFVLTDSIPEIEERPAEIALHLVAEFSTAFALMLAGYGMLKGREWATSAFLFASGLLTYTLIVSPGYYVTHDDPILVIMFSVFLLVDLLLVGSVLMRGYAAEGAEK